MGTDVQQSEPRQIRWHRDRERLLAEAHARPSTPLSAPVSAIRLANISGQEGIAADRAHMAALCRAFDQAPPDADARWWLIAVAEWSLRWERHTEFSSWTLFGPTTIEFDVLPGDWRAGFPGELLVATRLDIRPASETLSLPFASDGVMIGAGVFDGAARVFTDLRPDDAGFTRFRVLLSSTDAMLAGRLALVLLEIETYRMMALLAFPLAGAAGERIRAIEAEAGELAARLASDDGVDTDRALLARLIALSGEMEALSARTTFRFGAANAYYELVRDRIASLGETKIAGLQTIGEFMDRRLAPAMRTCNTVAERERAVIERIARAGAMLDTRIKVADEATNAALLTSMNQRADASLRLQRTVEGLSVAAISYYAVALLAYPMKAVEYRVDGFNATLALAVAAPVVAIAVWLVLRRIRRQIERG
jgi:uncharacterized membrane-anchored protein